MKRWLLFVVALSGVALGLGMSNAAACGGFFCHSAPVDQLGERIVFTINDDDTVTSLIEILYQGEADDFSWILPIPEAIDANALQVPEGGQDVFAELHTLTDVQFIAPPMPECAVIALESARVASAFADDDAGNVTVFASGDIGPFGFDVIGSDNPAALADWLRDNDYLVEPSMEPLIDVYVEEDFAFVAMRLLDGEDADSITPIEITYPGTQAMIPLRLTAVAAQPDMPIFTWIFADSQVVPENFAHMEIATAELTFSSFGQNNYRRLVADRADANDGRAFITEFAGPAMLDFQHDYLTSRRDRYLTRLFTVISPDEMTVDPMFVEDDRPDVSNVRDASQLVGLYDCARVDGDASDALDPFGGTNEMLTAPLVSDTAAIPVTVAAEATETSTAAEPAEAAATPLGDDSPGDRPVIWVVVAIAVALAVGVGFSLQNPTATRH